jgi:hypothetical protein
MGYASFREFAEDFTEMFTFQNDNNDTFIKTNNWPEGDKELKYETAINHPADSFFGNADLILNDDIIEMSQQSLYALTKILGNGYTVQEMKQQIFDSFEEAKSKRTLSFFSDRYTFPIDYCLDGFLVNGIITKNISPRGKSLYFSFEKTQIFRSGGAVHELKRRPVIAQNVDEEDKGRIYRLLTENFPFEKQIHMAAISKLLTDHGVDRNKYGCYKMKDFLAQLEYLELNDTVLGGVPQIMVTIHRDGKYDAEETKSAYAPMYREYSNHGVYHTVRADYSSESSHNSYAANGARYEHFHEDSPNTIPDGELEDFANMPPKPILIIQKFLERGGRTAEVYAIRKELNEDFRKARSEGAIRFYEQKMIFPCRYQKEDGSPVEITLKPSTYEGKQWFLYYVDTIVRDRNPYANHPGKQLENFAFLGSWSNFLTELAEKAIDEDWDFQNSPKKNYHILIQYIKYTFCRLMRENKVCISSDKQFAAFNTGLVDKHYDDIYACFLPNDPGSDTPWKFTGFCTAASRGLGKMLVNYFNPLPQPPRYFTRSEDLYFDLTKQLHSDFDHIIIDNIKRLPLQFLMDQFSDCEEAKELCVKISQTKEHMLKNAMYEELKTIISDNSKLFIRIQNRIKDSIELAKKRVRWNYKTAIPSYFPKRNSMSLMLPLCLSDEETPDVALVVELTQSGNYQGQTIITIPQAYIDARLMCRLTSDWLNPAQISISADDPDEQDFGSAFDEQTDAC